ncbi:MAG: LytTR family DNA-binding domain-containing protein [Acidobacteriaceae bacterium]
MNSGAQMHFLPVHEIDWIAADDNYIRLHANERSYLLRETLARMAEKLDPKHFRRVHRSAIINLSALQRIEPQFHGEYMLVLKSGQKVTLSRSYRDGFFASYGEGR